MKDGKKFDNIQLSKVDFKYVQSTSIRGPLSTYTTEVEVSYDIKYKRSAVSVRSHPFPLPGNITKRR